MKYNQSDYTNHICPLIKYHNREVMENLTEKTPVQREMAALLNKDAGVSYQCISCDAIGFTWDDPVFVDCREKKHTIMKFGVKADKKTHTDFAKQIMKNNYFKTLMEDNTLLIFDNGIYTSKNAVSIVQRECEKLIPNCSSYMVEETIKTIKRKTLNYNREDFDCNPNLITLENGIFNLETREFSAHSPEHLSRIKLPIFYNSKARQRYFIQFLKSSLEDPREISNILEEIASIFLPELNLKKYYMHVGNGDNGKSKLFDFITALVGFENTKHISIHDMTNNRFTLSELDGKLVNLHADIENDELKHLGKFKQLVSGDPIFVEKKGKQGFDMINKSKLFFSANQLPEINENNQATYTRPRITEWKIKFTSNPKVGEKQSDPDLLSKLTTTDEISGVFNLLVKHILNLKQNKRFTFTQSTEQIKKQWHDKSNPIQLFLKQNVKESKNGVVRTTELYSVYAKWCRENSVKTENVRKFNERVPEHIQVEKIRKRYDHVSDAWEGIELIKIVNGSLIE